jgi:HK97 family phage prohead protease
MPREQDPQLTDQPPHAGQPGRIVVPSLARLPELAAAPGEVDRFDPATMTGQIEAYPSVIGRPYRMGFLTWHQIEPGAFDASLAEQGGRVPIYVQHNWDWSERAPIGNTAEAEEVPLDDDVDDDARALRIAGRLYPDVPDGLACLHAMAAGALREWSIGYVIEEFRVEEDDDAGRRTVFVTRAELWEASVVLRGANPWTQTLDVAQRPPTGPSVEELRRAATAAGFDLTPMPPASEQPSGPEPARIPIEQLADRRRRRRLHELTR